MAQEKGELRTQQQEKFTRSKAMAEKLTVPKIPTPVDDLQEIYEYLFLREFSIFRYYFL